METPSRRSDHSCDQCRKGKRRCDAPTLLDERPDSCSNCKRYKKDCTFQWLSTRKRSRQQYRRRVAAGNIRNAPSEAVETSSTSTTYDSTFTTETPLLGDMSFQPRQEREDLSDNYSLFPIWSENQATQSNDAQCPIFSSESQKSQPQIHDIDEHLQDPYKKANHRDSSHHTLSRSIDGGASNFNEPEQIGLASDNLPETAPTTEDSVDWTRRFSTNGHLCALSNQTARKYARFTITKNLIRIYHDSMENALSCWLNERNCPYSRRSTRDAKSRTESSEWGPNFSNRICTRVCRLDSAAASIRGRSLSVAEDKTASVTLHKSIMAFASQWAQNAQKDTNNLDLHSWIGDEKAFRDSLWNDARHALETSVGIPSFRVVFANILFSLTQMPIKEEQDIELSDLIETDRAHVFLENAVRQLFSFRYKFSQGRPGIHQKRSSPEAFKVSDSGISPHVDVSDIENRDTFDLLFWLGVMFDTQIAAMHQRPPVVSDEDSQKGSDLVWKEASFSKTGCFLDLDGYNISSHRLRKENRDLWGDFFLEKPASHQKPDKYIPIWPFTQEQAAEILSDAAPVKVLLWRRITQLQTLVYREAEPGVIEEGIQKALLVYRHWNSSYNIFILNCVSNHAALPPRVQSWYVVLAAHWHLGAMLLADVIDITDEAQLTLEHQRESRNAIEFSSNLRRDNASAVATLARCSLYEDVSLKSHQFHDSLSDAAFLTEPFTVLLIHSFAKSGYILLDNLQVSISSVYCGPIGSFDRFRQGCEVCIRALRCLGRKSDMASLVARGLAKKLHSVDEKLRPMSEDHLSLNLEYLVGIEDLSWEPPGDPLFNLATFPTKDHEAWVVD